MFYLKPLTPDMEPIHTATIYHFLKKKSPKIVRLFNFKRNILKFCFFIQDICCVKGPRAEELFSLARHAKVSRVTPERTLFILSPKDLYVFVFCHLTQYLNEILF